MDQQIVPQVFSSDQFGEVRALKDDSGPLFVLKDIMAPIGLTNTTKAVSGLEEDEFTTIQLTDALGRTQGTYVITEAGLYSLILRSRKPEARSFKRWVTHEVLPAIRRDGGYMVARDETPEETMARAVLLAQRTIERKDAAIARLAEDNARMLPKAEVYDVAIKADGTMSLTEAARYIGQIDRSMTRRRLIGLLRADGMLCERDNSPTRRALDTGRMVQMLTTRADGRANRPYAHLTRKGLDWCVRAYCHQAAIS